MYFLEAIQLTKRYGDFTAVDAIDFHVEQGDMFGFLGPNGAGKTSTINMLIGLARIDGGSVKYAGSEYAKQVDSRAQRLMGIVPDESNLYNEMSGLENLIFCGALYAMDRREREPRARELIERVGLGHAASQSFGKYSRGMKRKLTIAAALMHRPEILFLDETTTGLDVVSAREIRQLIRELNQSGTTVFLTTHYIEEAEQLCHRVAFLVDGRIVRRGAVSDLLDSEHEESSVQLALDTGAADAASGLAKAFPHVRMECVDDRTIRIYSGTALNVAPFLAHCERSGLSIYEAKVLRPSLEDVFVRATGLGLSEMQNSRGGKQL